MSTIFSWVFRSCHMSSHTDQLIRSYTVYLASIYIQVRNWSGLGFHYIPSLSFLHSSFLAKRRIEFIHVFTYVIHFTLYFGHGVNWSNFSWLPHEFDTFAIRIHISSNYACVQIPPFLISITLHFSERTLGQSSMRNARNSRYPSSDTNPND